MSFWSSDMAFETPWSAGFRSTHRTAGGPDGASLGRPGGESAARRRGVPGGGCLHPCLGGASIVPERPRWRPRGLSQPRQGVAGEPKRGKEAHVAMYEAYCVKCRAKREFEGSVVELKNGRKAAQGTCPVCGTKVMRILGKSAT